MIKWTALWAFALILFQSFLTQAYFVQQVMGQGIHPGITNGCYESVLDSNVKEVSEDLRDNYQILRTAGQKISELQIEIKKIELKIKRFQLEFRQEITRLDEPTDIDDVVFKDDDDNDNDEIQFKNSGAVVQHGCNTEADAEADEADAEADAEADEAEADANILPDSINEKCIKLRDLYDDIVEKLDEKNRIKDEIKIIAGEDYIKEDGTYGDIAEDSLLGSYKTLLEEATENATEAGCPGGYCLQPVHRAMVEESEKEKRPWLKTIGKSALALGSLYLGHRTNRHIAQQNASIGLSTPVNPATEYGFPFMLNGLFGANNGSQHSSFTCGEQQGQLSQQQKLLMFWAMSQGGGAGGTNNPMMAMMPFLLSQGGSGNAMSSMMPFLLSMGNGSGTNPMMAMMPFLLSQGSGGPGSGTLNDPMMMSMMMMAMNNMNRNNGLGNLGGLDGLGNLGGLSGLGNLGGLGGLTGSWEMQQALNEARIKRMEEMRSIQARPESRCTIYESKKNIDNRASIYYTTSSAARYRT